MNPPPLFKISFQEQLTRVVAAPAVACTSSAVASYPTGSYSMVELRLLPVLLVGFLDQGSDAMNLPPLCSGVWKGPVGVLLWS